MSKFLVETFTILRKVANNLFVKLKAEGNFKSILKVMYSFYIINLKFIFKVQEIDLKSFYLVINDPWNLKFRLIFKVTNVECCWDY